MLTHLRFTGQVGALLAGLLVASQALAQEVTSPAEKNQSAKGEAASKKPKEQSAKLAQAAALLKDFISARDAFRREQSEQNGEALDKSYLALAKARVPTSTGACALEAAYDHWGQPNGVLLPTWDYTFQQLAAWRKVRPESAPACIATGKAYLRFAWEARGNGFAAKVSEEKFMVFRSRMDQARIFLQLAEVKTGVDAELYRLLIEVSKADGSPPEEAAEWLQKARKLDPLYEPAFTAMAESLMPRWGGEEGDLEKFSRDVLSKLEGDEGQMIHAKVAGRLCMYGHTEYLDSKDSRERVHAGAKLLADNYPTSIWCQNFGAVVGTYCGDLKLCKQTLPIVEKSQVEALWSPKFYEAYLKIAKFEIPQRASLPDPPKTKFLAFLKATGQLATVGGEGKKAVSLWDLAGNDPIATYPLPSVNIRGFAPTADGKRIFLTYRMTTEIRDVAAFIELATGDLQVFSDDETKLIRGICITSDGKWAATIDGEFGNQVTVWDVAAHKALQRLPHKGSKDIVEFSASGKHIAVAVNSQTDIWEWEQKKVVLIVDSGRENGKLGDYDGAQFVGFRGGDEPLFYAHARPPADNVFIACGLEDKRLSVLARTPRTQFESFRISPNKKFLAAGYRSKKDSPQIQTVQMWDLEQGQLLGEIPPATLERWLQVDFSPDSSYVAHCSPSPRGFDLHEIDEFAKTLRRSDK